MCEPFQLALASNHMLTKFTKNVRTQFTEMFTHMYITAPEKIRNAN